MTIIELTFNVQSPLSLGPALLSWRQSSPGKAITAGKPAQNRALDLQRRLSAIKDTGSLTEKPSMTLIYYLHGNT